MELVFSWHVDADTDIERAMMYDKAEEAARIAQGVEHGNRILESWVLRSHGRMLGEAAGVSGSAQMAAEYLEELPDIVRQVEEATKARMHVGVGVEPSEAVVARKVAEERGGDPAIVLYTPDLSEEARRIDELSDDEADALDESVDDDGATGGMDAGAAAAAAPAGGAGMAKAENQQEGGEATQVAQGKLSPNAAMPSPPPSPGPSSASPAASPDQGGASQTPPQGGEPSDEDVLGAVGQVLEQFKQQLPFFEQQVKQANPQAYQTVLGMMKAMVAMAQDLAGGTAKDEPPPGAAAGGMQKSEGDAWHIQYAHDPIPGATPAARSYVTHRGGYTAAPTERTLFQDRGAAEALVQALAQRHGRSPDAYSIHPGPGTEVFKGEVDPETGEASKVESEPHEKPRARGRLSKEDLSAEATKEHEEHPWTTPEQAKRIAADHEKLGKEEPPSTRHNLNLPVGSRGVGGRARSVKVMEPVTGKTSWHQVSVGQKLSGDNHTLSPRVGECPSADSPERRAQQAGLAGAPSASKPGQTAGE